MASDQLVCSLATMVVTVAAWSCGRLDKVVAEVMRKMNWRVELEFLHLLFLMIKTALMVATVLLLQCSLRVHSQQLTAQQIMSCSLQDVDSYVSGLDHHVGRL